jgi:hypothetical protein
MPRSRHRRKLARKHHPRRLTDFDPSRPPMEDEKMSEVLLEFIEPYRHLARDDTALEKLIALGAVAWNVSLLPESERASALDQFATGLFRGKRFALLRRFGRMARNWMRRGRGVGADGESAEEADFKAMVYELIEQKLRRFAHNRRMIVSYQVNFTDGDVQVFVASTLDQTGVK